MEEQPECRGVKKLQIVLDPNPSKHGNSLMGSHPLAHGYSIDKFFSIYLAKAIAVTLSCSADNSKGFGRGNSSPGSSA